MDMVSLRYELSKLKDMSPEFLSELGKESWLVQGLINLYELCNNCCQCDNYDNGSYREVRRVVKLKKIVPDFYLDLYGLNKVNISGVYTDMDGILISKTLMDEYFEKRMKSAKGLIYDPVKHLNLPPDYDYMTIRTLDDGQGFALKYCELVPNFLAHPRDWDYLELND